jgi:hypothetical protein
MKSFKIKYFELINLIFVTFFVGQVFSQSKKEQINFLNVRIDSLVNVLNNNKLKNNDSIDVLNKEIKSLNSNISDIEYNKNKFKIEHDECRVIKHKLLIDFLIKTDSLKQIINEIENNNPKDIDTNTFNQILNSVFQDSIKIASNFSYTPFDLNEGNQFNYFQNILYKSTKKISKKIKNIYTNKYSNVHKIYWGKSYVEIFEDDMIQHAEIIDENISLLYNIKIGQTLESICDRLNIKFKKNIKYKFIEITNPPTKAGCALYFYFNNNILTKVIYSPYTG